MINDDTHSLNTLSLLVFVVKAKPDIGNLTNHYLMLHTISGEIMVYIQCAKMEYQK